jgi:hypothetical protein
MKMNSKDYAALFVEKCERRGLLPVHIFKDPNAGPGVAIGKRGKPCLVGLPGCYEGITRLSRREAIRQVYNRATIWGEGRVFEPGWSKFRPKNHVTLAKLVRASQQLDRLLDRYH